MDFGAGAGGCHSHQIVQPVSRIKGTITQTNVSHDQLCLVGRGYKVAYFIHLLEHARINTMSRMFRVCA